MRSWKFQRTLLHIDKIGAIQQSSIGNGIISIYPGGADEWQPVGLKESKALHRDVAVLPPQDVRDIITRGGFDAPVLFFQAGMIHAWFAKRSAS